MKSGKVGILSVVAALLLAPLPAVAEEGHEGHAAEAAADAAATPAATAAADAAHEAAPSPTPADSGNADATEATEKKEGE